MKKKNIPEEVRKEIQKIINEYNEVAFKNTNIEYFPEYKKNFLYLKRKELTGSISPIARLTYTENINNWKFAIFKWSSESYDSEEWFFPGSEHINDTILGALKAGNEAYPCGY